MAFLAVSYDEIVIFGLKLENEQNIMHFYILQYKKRSIQL